MKKLIASLIFVSLAELFACDCPRDYSPVCGSDNRAYANACLAQCNGVSYTPGSCPDDPDRQPTLSGSVDVGGPTFVGNLSKSEESCRCNNTSFDPVCGSNNKTYKNFCFAKCDNVNDYVIGSCSGEEALQNHREFTVEKAHLEPSDVEVSERKDSSSQLGVAGSSKADDKVQKITREKQEIKKPNALMSNIALLGIGVLTPVFVQECYNVPSAWIGGASAALYIANEMGLISKYKEGSKRSLEAFKNLPNAQQKQILSLQKAARETDVAAKAAGTKAKFANLAKTGFMMASATAIAEGVLTAMGVGDFRCNGAKPKPGDVSTNVEANPTPDQLNSCVSYKPETVNTDTMDTTASGLGDDPVRTMGRVVVTAGRGCSASLNNLEEQLHFAHSTRNQADLNSFFHFIEHRRFNSHDINLQSPSLKEYEKIKKLNILSFGGKLKELFDVFIPSAQAFNPAAIASLGLGATAGTELLKYTGGLSKVLGKAVMLPPARAAIFGGFSLLTGTAANDMKKAEEGYKHRADQYRDLASELQEKTKITGFDLGDVDLGGLNLKRQCFQGGRLELEVDPACECLKDKTCKNPQFPDLAKVNGLRDIDVLKNGTRDLQGIAQGVYQGTLTESDPRINSVLGQTEKLESLRSDLLKKMNDQRRKDGFIDYPLEEAERVSANTMGQQIQGAYQKLSPDLQGQIASRLGRSPSDFGGTLSEVKSDLEEENKIIRPKREARLNFQDSKADAVEPVTKSQDDFSLDFAFDDSSSTKNQGDIEAQQISNQDFSEVRNDIKPREGDSIFDTLHKRYQKEFN